MTSLAGLTLWVALAAPGLSPPAPADAGPDPVRPVLAGEGFPWYDAGAGRVKPILPWPDFGGGWLKSVGDWLSRRGKAVSRWFRWLNYWRIPWIGGMGDLIAIGLAMLLLTLVLVLLLELLRRYRPLGGDEPTPAAVLAGSARRIEGLPAGVRLDAADPRAEAERLRALGDYAGAVVYLFAHQLLTLERIKQIRLVPGRTGRQLVRSVGDRQIRGGVEPTLRLFEAVYYGRRAPTAPAFEAVWAQAMAFERQVSAGVVS